MARITVEDCLKKTDSQYDLVLLAKERTSQLNAGDKSLVTENNDKNTVISLREIGEGKVSLKTIEDSAINKLRKAQPETADTEDVNSEEEEDDFDKIYKGEISKSGAAILPSKRARKMPEKIMAPKENDVEPEIKEETEVKEEVNQNDQLEEKEPSSTEEKTE